MPIKEALLSRVLREAIQQKITRRFFLEFSGFSLTDLLLGRKPERIQAAADVVARLPLERTRSVEKQEKPKNRFDAVYVRGQYYGSFAELGISVTEVQGQADLALDLEKLVPTTTQIEEWMKACTDYPQEDIPALSQILDTSLRHEAMIMFQTISDDGVAQFGTIPESGQTIQDVFDIEASDDPIVTDANPFPAYLLEIIQFIKNKQLVSADCYKRTITKLIEPTFKANRYHPERVPVSRMEDPRLVVNDISAYTDWNWFTESTLTVEQRLIARELNTQLSEPFIDDSSVLKPAVEQRFDQTHEAGKIEEYVQAKNDAVDPLTKQKNFFDSLPTRPEIEQVAETLYDLLKNDPTYQDQLPQQSEALLEHAIRILQTVDKYALAATISMQQAYEISDTYFNPLWISPHVSMFLYLNLCTADLRLLTQADSFSGNKRIEASKAVFYRLLSVLNTAREESTGAEGESIFASPVGEANIEFVSQMLMKFNDTRGEYASEIAEPLLEDPTRFRDFLRPLQLKVGPKAFELFFDPALNKIGNFGQNNQGVLQLNIGAPSSIGEIIAHEDGHNRGPNNAMEAILDGGISWREMRLAEGVMRAAMAKTRQRDLTVQADNDAVYRYAFSPTGRRDYNGIGVVHHNILARLPGSTLVPKTDSDVFDREERITVVTEAIRLKNQILLAQSQNKELPFEVTDELFTTLRMILTLHAYSKEHRLLDTAKLSPTFHYIEKRTILSDLAVLVGMGINRLYPALYYLLSRGWLNDPAVLSNENITFLLDPNTSTNEMVNMLEAKCLQVSGQEMFEQDTPASFMPLAVEHVATTIGLVGFVKRDEDAFVYECIGNEMMQSDGPDRYIFTELYRLYDADFRFSADERATFFKHLNHCLNRQGDGLDTFECAIKRIIERIQTYNFATTKLAEREKFVTFFNPLLRPAPGQQPLVVHKSMEDNVRLLHQALEDYRQAVA